MKQNTELRIIQQLQTRIENQLHRVGLLFRVFARCKTDDSITKKIDGRTPGYYSEDGKKIQDLFGVRIALYFPDDLKIAQKALESIFTLDSQQVDNHDSSLFSATRCNFVFQLPQELVEESHILRTNPLVDSTFEVQFRTVLSEGWHEVEHDLRYKCADDWDQHDDLSRALNGIYASLETSEWAMTRLFEDLAYRHYKSSEWAPMIRNKFRLRAGNELNQQLEQTITDTEGLGKKIYRLNRSKLLTAILKYDINLPINIDNLVYICNYFFIRSAEVNDVTPPIVKLTLDQLVKRKEE
ncbi:RelA/SpoT domain-containing protein [Vibrio sp. Vb339]|uniref:RelA/SpoT domain-containing protein n=1 Tax=Vibrio sp. Vb339 TaxID=1192013 RepID=UPI001554DC46|nr:RelA/SpoT domain-containing protein [Vibrio sp. Vb339]